MPSLTKRIWISFCSPTDQWCYGGKRSWDCNVIYIGFQIHWLMAVHFMIYYFSSIVCVSEICIQYDCLCIRFYDEVWVDQWKIQLTRSNIKNENTCATYNKNISSWYLNITIHKSKIIMLFKTRKMHISKCY